MIENKDLIVLVITGVSLGVYILVLEAIKRNKIKNRYKREHPTPIKECYQPLPDNFYIKIKPEDLHYDNIPGKIIKRALERDYKPGFVVIDNKEIHEISIEGAKIFKINEVDYNLLLLEIKKSIELAGQLNPIILTIHKI